MAKQRFVVYKAIDKDSAVMRSLLVVGGKSMPFLGNTSSSTNLKRTSDTIMRLYGQTSLSINGWLGFARRKGARRIQKVIYFN